MWHNKLMTITKLCHSNNILIWSGLWQFDCDSNNQNCNVTTNNIVLSTESHNYSLCVLNKEAEHFTQTTAPIVVHYKQRNSISYSYCSETRHATSQLTDCFLAANKQHNTHHTAGCIRTTATIINLFLSLFLSIPFQLLDLSYLVPEIQNVSIMDFMGAKDGGGGGDNCSCMMYNAPVKLSPIVWFKSFPTQPPANQHPALLQAGCPSCCPTNSVKAPKEKNSKITLKKVDWLIKNQNY